MRLAKSATLPCAGGMCHRGEMTPDLALTTIKFVRLRPDFLAICDGRVPDALILGALESWAARDEWHKWSHKYIERDTMGAVTKKQAIPALKRLLDKGFVSRQGVKERGWQYRFETAAINAAIAAAKATAPLARAKTARGPSPAPASARRAGPEPNQSGAVRGPRLVPREDPSGARRDPPVVPPGDQHHEDSPRLAGEDCSKTALETPGAEQTRESFPSSSAPHTRRNRPQIADLVVVDRRENRRPSARPDPDQGVGSFGPGDFDKAMRAYEARVANGARSRSGGTAAAEPEAHRLVRHLRPT
jgi:hypothetical protein